MYRLISYFKKGKINKKAIICMQRNSFFSTALFDKLNKMKLTQTFIAKNHQFSNFVRN